MGLLSSDRTCISQSCLRIVTRACAINDQYFDGCGRSMQIANSAAEYIMGTGVNRTSSACWDDGVYSSPVQYVETQLNTPTSHHPARPGFLKSASFSALAAKFPAFDFPTRTLAKRSHRLHGGTYGAHGPFRVKNMLLLEHLSRIHFSSMKSI